MDAFHRLAELFITQNQQETAIQTSQKGVQYNHKTLSFIGLLSSGLGFG